MKSLILLLSFDGSFIRQLDKPACIQCKYYLPETGESYESSESKCTKFGGKDLHTGVILYDYATSVRSDESKCSTVGRYFVGEKQWFYKKWYHWLRNLFSKN